MDEDPKNKDNIQHEYDFKMRASKNKDNFKNEDNTPKRSMLIFKMSSCLRLYSLVYLFSKVIYIFKPVSQNCQKWGRICEKSGYVTIDQPYKSMATMTSMNIKSNK